MINIDSRTLKYIMIVTIFVSGVSLCSCGVSPFDRRPHKVTGVIDGNTIVVDQAVTIGLIGINNSSASEDYLRNNFMNQVVRFVYDTKKREPVTGYNSKIYGYISTLGLKRSSVNAEILKRGLSNLNFDFLNDSLKAFMLYTGGATAAGTSESQTVREQSNNTLPGTMTDGSFVTLVNRVKSAVFTIFRQNSDGELTGLGTGFFVSSMGVGVSNYHVFDGGASFVIKTLDQRQFSLGEILAADQRLDFIVFKIDGNVDNLSFLQFNDELPQQGEEIFVIGNPSGLESTVTKGIVSAVRSRFSENDLIQIDAAISPGSSGSPVCNMTGNVVGIATFKILIEGCEMCNFAISSGPIKDALAGSQNK
jgi:serine protease Do